MQDCNKILVETLTPEELERLVKQEEGKVFGLIEKTESSYRRFMIKYKPKGEYMFKTLHSIKGDCGLDYKFYFLSCGYSFYKKHGLLHTLYIPYRTTTGFGALFAVYQKDGENAREGAISYAYFTPHFFSRYAEREKLAGLDKLEVMEHFFRRNSTSTSVPFPYSDRYPNNDITLLSGGGIAFSSQEEGKLRVFKTYLSKEEFKEDQEAIYNEKAPNETIEKLYLNCVKDCNNS